MEDFGSFGKLVIQSDAFGSWLILKIILSLIAAAIPFINV